MLKKPLPVEGRVAVNIVDGILYPLIDQCVQILSHHGIDLAEVQPFTVSIDDPYPIGMCTPSVYADYVYTNYYITLKAYIFWDYERQGTLPPTTFGVFTKIGGWGILNRRKWGILDRR